MSEEAKCYTRLNPKARKQHRCCECDGVIEVGEKYHVFKGVWDEPQTYKTCADCEKERDRYVATLDQCYEEYPAFGYLYEHIYEWDFKDFMRVIEIRKKRGSKIFPWMEERIARGS